MFELAYNVNGEPFDVPPTMAAWRVRKLKPKGAPEVVYGRDGLPLFLPMDADIEDLRREARADGRYRLDPVDDHNRAVPNAQAGYVCVHPIERVPEPAPQAPSATAGAQSDINAALVAALLESQKQHTELARMYVSQFPVVANAMAGVVRSAGDVGLTARVPLVLPAAPTPKPDGAVQQEPETDEIDDDESESDETESDETDDEIASDEVEVEVAQQPEYSWARVAQTFADHVTPHVGPLLAGLPGLASMLGTRRAPAATDAARGPDRTDPAPAEAEPSAPSGPIAGFDAAMLVRLNAIKARLTPVEQQFAQTLIDEIPATELPIWLGRLKSMSVDEAVAYVRTMFHKGQATAARTRPAESPIATAAPRSAARSAAVPPTAPSAPSAPSDARREGRRPMPASIATPTGTRPAPRPAPGNGLALLDEGTQAHLAAIDQALTLDEAAALRKQFAALPPRERASWVATLVMLPVADAIAAIRAQLAGADASATAASPAGVSTGSEPQDAPAASIPTPRDSNASTSRDGASSTSAREPVSGESSPVSTHDLSAPSVLPTAPAAEPVVLDRDADCHLAEVESALTPDERVRMHAMFGTLSPDERDVWLDRLLSAPPTEGTEMLREALGGEKPQPLTSEPTVNGALVTSAAASPSDDAPRSAIETPEDESTRHEPPVDAPELGEAAEVDETTDGNTHQTAGDAVVQWPEPIAPGEESPTTEADAGKHLAAIEGALTLAEKMRAHELAAQRPAAELRRWYADLLRLSVPDAVAKIRAELARSNVDPHATKKGGVS